MKKRINKRAQETPVPDLKAEWEALIGRPPPIRASRDHLTRAIAWHRQIEASRPKLRKLERRLGRLVAEIEGGKPFRLRESGAAIKPGTQLIKSWQGQEYRVMALENGFAWNGKTWDSLSEIAREITGTRWNGPAFFGLRKKSS